ncbi:MAG: hypothetical protein ABFC89_03950 [Methanospirillum sp.]
MAELVRVLRPGGVIVAVEPDWGTLALDPGEPDVVRRLAMQCAAGFPDGWTGRKLGRYFRNAGLEEVRVGPATAVVQDLPTVLKAMNIGPSLEAAVEFGRIASAEAQTLLETLKEADRAGTFLFSMTVFRAIGRRPGAG